MQYQFVHAEDQELLDKVFRFRYKVMSEELNIIGVNENKEEKDEYDDFSDHFAVLNDRHEVCATMRLIHNSPIGYPTEHYCNLDEEKMLFNRKKLAEVSRIFIGAEYRNMKDTKLMIIGIIKSMAYAKTKEYGIEYCYGSLERSFIKLLNMFKIPYVVIGDGAEYNGAYRYPAILYIKAIEFENPQLLKQWNKRMKLDSLRICRRQHRTKRAWGLKAIITQEYPTNKYFHRMMQ